MATYIRRCRRCGEDIKLFLPSELVTHNGMLKSVKDKLDQKEADHKKMCPDTKFSETY